LAKHTYATIDCNTWLSEYDYWLSNEMEDLIDSALKDIYGVDYVIAFVTSTSSGNLTYSLKIDSYTSIFAIPNSEKFYYAFCSSRKLTKEPDSYNATHLITLN
jgi:hypothetical protein